ncbi:2392_t:CDS:2, partial [Gigaspora margarita]
MASTKHIYKENNRNGCIPDFCLRVVIPKKKVEIMVSKKRKLVNYKTTDINHEIREQFSDIDLFAIQLIGYTKLALFIFDLVDRIFYRLQKFVVVSISFSPSQ